MLIQHFTPKIESSNVKSSIQQIYYRSIMVYACGSFALAVLIIISSTASIEIGRLRSQTRTVHPDDKISLMQNMEENLIET